MGRADAIKLRKRAYMAERYKDPEFDTVDAVRNQNNGKDAYQGADCRSRNRLLPRVRRICVPNSTPLVERPKNAAARGVEEEAVLQILLSHSGIRVVCGSFGSSLHPSPTSRRSR